MSAGITDPPFGINLGETRTGDIHYDVYEDNPSDVYDLLKALVPEWYRVLKRDAFVVVWTSYQMWYPLRTLLENAGFKVKWTPLIWVKSGYLSHSRDSERGIGNTTEIAIYGYKGSPSLKMTVMTNVLTFPIPKSGRVHVAQKPESLQRQLLSMFTTEGDIVLDCFAGSGSLSRAAIDMNRRPIAFELDETNYENAISYSYTYWRLNNDR